MNRMLYPFFNLGRIARAALPRKAFSDKSIGGKPRVIVNSFPKSGTHLLGKLVKDLGFIDLPVMLLNDSFLDYRRHGNWDSWKPLMDSGLVEFSNPSRKEESTAISLRRIRRGQICTSHLRYSRLVRSMIRVLKIKHLFIVRDIRDCVISQQIWRMDLKAHDHLPNWYFYLNALENETDRILAVMEGRDRFLEPYSYHLDYGLGWLDDPDVYLVRYENLIGPRGGGSSENQINEIRGIVRFLDGSTSDREISAIADNLWGGKTRTMKYGRSRYWKDKFTDSLDRTFWRHYGKYMEKMGYAREP
jgi:hypothetical protein